MFPSSSISFFPLVIAASFAMATLRPEVEPFLPLTSATTASTVFSTTTRSLTFTPSQHLTVRPDVIITYPDTTLTIDGSRLWPTLEPYDIGTCFGLPALSTETVEEIDTVQVTLTEDIITRSLTTYASWKPTVFSSEARSMTYTAAEETEAEATSLPTPSMFSIMTLSSGSEELSTKISNLLMSNTATTSLESSTSDGDGTAHTTIPIAQSDGRRAYKSDAPWNGAVFLFVLIGMEMVFVGGGLMGVLNWLLICVVVSAIIVGVEARPNMPNFHERRQLVANPDHFPFGEYMRVPGVSAESGTSIQTVLPTYGYNFANAANVDVVSLGITQSLNVTILNIKTTSEQETATVAFMPAAFTLTITGPLPTTLLALPSLTKTSLSSDLEWGMTSASITGACSTSSPTNIDNPNMSTILPPLVDGLPRGAPDHYPYAYPNDAAKSSSSGHSIELSHDKILKLFFTTYFLLIGFYISATLRSPARVFLTVALIWICQVVFLGAVAEDGMGEGRYIAYGDWVNLRSLGEVKPPPNEPVELTTTISSTLTLPIYVVVPDTKTINNRIETLAETPGSQLGRTKTLLITDTEREESVTLTLTEPVAPTTLEKTEIAEAVTPIPSVSTIASTSAPITLTTEVTVSHPASTSESATVVIATESLADLSVSTSISSLTSLPHTYPYPYPDSLTSSAEGALEPKVWIANAWIIMFIFMGLNIALTSPSSLHFMASMALLALVVSLMVGITLDGLEGGRREF